MYNEEITTYETLKIFDVQFKNHFKSARIKHTEHAVIGHAFYASYYVFKNVYFNLKLQKFLKFVHTSILSKGRCCCSASIAISVSLLLFQWYWTLKINKTQNWNMSDTLVAAVIIKVKW